MKSFRDLQVWEKSHQLTLYVYKITGKFPTDERFGLVSQMGRCAVSIPANIAEGCGRRGNGEFHKFLQIATGSASELAYHFLLSKDLGFLDAIIYAELDSDNRSSKNAGGPYSEGRSRAVQGNFPQLISKC